MDTRHFQYIYFILHEKACVTIIKSLRSSRSTLSHFLSFPDQIFSYSWSSIKHRKFVFKHICTCSMTEDNRNRWPKINVLTSAERFCQWLSWGRLVTPAQQTNGARHSNPSLAYLHLHHHQRFVASSRRRLPNIMCLHVFLMSPRASRFVSPTHSEFAAVQTSNDEEHLRYDYIFDRRVTSSDWPGRISHDVRFKPLWHY